MQLVTIAMQPPSTIHMAASEKNVADTSTVLLASNQQEVAINKAKKFKNFGYRHNDGVAGRPDSNAQHDKAAAAGVDGCGQGRS